MTANLTLEKVFYEVGVAHAFEHVIVVTDGTATGDKIIGTNLNGEILAEHTGPHPGLAYVGNGRRPGQRERSPGVSPTS